ncbi:MAG: four helix bundle protein [Candidatus Omnitrophica bacterium]|nr:four helix bundle protein [Candidatus Omnitrophota bacterium]MBU4472653.1 four helix bundle protein [Candidatus Omnitrophota bacterium]MCG2706724.1 four helix bundle protein [Candidatus Omnitrophota bacterium]
MEDKNSVFDFEKLKVYQKALDFIDKIFEICKNLPREYKYSLGDNLLRAGLSIANNLAEGNGKKSKREKQRYFGISLDSTRECISVFNVFKRQKLITNDRFLEIRSDSREITGMIYNLIGSLA